jgi:hypothetical protein
VDCVAEFSAAQSGRVNWDQPAGERWALFVAANGGLGNLSVLAPLLFATDSFDVDGMDLMRLVVVRVPSFQTEILTCDLSVLLSFFSAEEFTPEFDSSCFCFQDLYFETVH